MGEFGFGIMIDDLAGINRTLGQCDIGVSAITVTSGREAMGLTFSRATYRSSLAIMTYAPLKRRGMWAFFTPLHLHVWMALLVTIVVTPFFVFFFESVFSGRCDACHCLDTCSTSNLCSVESSAMQGTCSARQL
jgi:hypothetical protein